jgi:hypothetical protein
MITIGRSRLNIFSLLLKKQAVIFLTTAYFLILGINGYVFLKHIHILQGQSLLNQLLNSMKFVVDNLFF